MAKFSTGLLVGLQITGAFRTLMNGSELRIYSGPVPAHADEALTGAHTLLCALNNDGTPFTFENDAPGGVISKALDELLQGINVASGVAAFFRQVLPSDAGAASTSEKRVQGTVGLVGTDIELDDLTFTAGAPTKLDYYYVALLEE